MSKKIRTMVFGALGRMGKEVSTLLLNDPKFEYVCGIDRDDMILLSKDKTPYRVLNLEEAIRLEADVIIDFSAATALERLLKKLTDKPLALVIGTTSLSKAQESLINDIATHVALVQSPNMSKLMNMFFYLTHVLSSKLEDEDIEILEMHHKNKKDAPSGTALELAKIVRESRPGFKFIFGRHGNSSLRRRDEIGVLAMRGGDVVGDHTVFYLSEGERLDITHRAASRKAFASGALLAASWIVGKPKGRYSMADVLGISY